jgi:hypothetical protein
MCIHTRWQPTSTWSPTPRSPTHSSMSAPTTPVFPWVPRSATSPRTHCTNQPHGNPNRSHTFTTLHNWTRVHTSQLLRHTGSGPTWEEPNQQQQQGAATADHGTCACFGGFTHAYFLHTRRASSLTPMPGKHAQLQLAGPPQTATAACALVVVASQPVTCTPAWQRQRAGLLQAD